MHIKNRKDYNSIIQNLNILCNTKSKNKYYSIPNMVEYFKSDPYTEQLKVNGKPWILREHTVQAFNDVVNKIPKYLEISDVVSYLTVYRAVKEELESEITCREQGHKKRESCHILESIKQAIDSKISNFGFFYLVEGLQLKNIDKISCKKVEILVFNQELRDQLIAFQFRESNEQNLEALRRTEDFIDNNFLNCVCIKSTAYGDLDTARKKAYKQAKELINYFRYVVCLLSYERVSDQIIKISFLSEAYTNIEKLLIINYKDNTLPLNFDRWRKPLEDFTIDENCHQELSDDDFLDDFIEIINSPSPTEVEGCILTAIYWIGEAQNEFDLDVAFVKYWTALECIFTGSNNPTESLAKGVATILAFISNEFIKIEDTKKVEQNMRKLYDKRSDIIHRGMNYLANQVINKDDVSKICKYTAWSIRSLFHLRSIGYTTMDEIRSPSDTIKGMGRASKALKQVLETYDISQNSLAVAMGVKRTVVFRWFHETRDPTAETVVEIVVALKGINLKAAQEFVWLYLGELVQNEEK